EQYGAQVRSAGSTAQALSIVEIEELDIIVSDIGMPELDGYELIRRVRQQGIQIPAIALTAYTRAEDRIRALTAGYQFHLSKPVDPDELAVVVSSLVPRERKD
ncbi:MAG TPA: response regulator, partial [Blastocatellia bacterium]|nr:response regulator [Blastocatellia bacterium]